MGGRTDLEGSLKYKSRRRSPRGPRDRMPGSSRHVAHYPGRDTSILGRVQGWGQLRTHTSVDSLVWPSTNSIRCGRCQLRDFQSVPMPSAGEAHGHCRSLFVDKGASP